MLPINAGIYILSPSTLDTIPSEGAFDMPDLIQSLISQERKVGTYFIDGEWQDLGTMESYEKVNSERERFIRKNNNLPGV